MENKLTNVIFVRHAQSIYGENDRIRPLTEEGLEDRKMIFEGNKLTDISELSYVDKNS